MLKIHYICIMDINFTISFFEWMGMSIVVDNVFIIDDDNGIHYYYLEGFNCSTHIKIKKADGVESIEINYNVGSIQKNYYQLDYFLDSFKTEIRQYKLDVLNM